MSDNVEFSAIYTLLKRLNLIKYADSFKERGINRLITVRQLPPATWKELVPDEADREHIIAALNKGGNQNPNKRVEDFNSHDTNSGNQHADPSQGVNEGNRRNHGERQQNYRDLYRTSTPTQEYHGNNHGNNRQGYGNGFHNNNNHNFTSNRHGEFRQGRGGNNFEHRGRGANFHYNRTGNDNGNTNDFYQNDRNRNSSGNYRNNVHALDVPKTKNRLCRNFFSEEGCRFDNKCRYLHEDVDTGSGFPLSCGPLLEHELMLKECNTHSAEICVPVVRVKYLLGQHGHRIRAINDKYGVRNETIPVLPLNESVSVRFRIFGKTAESVEGAKNEIYAVCGLVNEGKMKERFHHILHELELHTRACRTLCAANTANKGTPCHMSEKVLRYIISTFRFPPPQDIRHFFIQTEVVDRDKLDVLSKFVAQMDGVQAIIFCEAARVSAMISGGSRISRCMNHALPIFVHPGMPKEERMRNLQMFKEGVPNEQGVIQRLLITTSDFAKLARKTEIPYVNFVIHFSQPRSAEFYALQSSVVGRHGTVGASVLCSTANKGVENFAELVKTISFTKLDSELAFCETSASLTYETLSNPLTSPNAYPSIESNDQDNAPSS